MKTQPKNIGTVDLHETSDFSALTPWDPVTKERLPFSVLSEPSGFLFAHGSACASMATTSTQGYTYVEDVYVFRKDGTTVDTDRYLGSVTPDNSLAVLKVPNSQIPFHHLRSSDNIIKELPEDKQLRLLNILEEQNP